MLQNKFCSLKKMHSDVEIKQDLVFSVKLHFGLTLYPLSLILNLYPLSPIPTPCSLSLVLFLSRNVGEGYCCDYCDSCCHCPKQK